MDGTSKPNSGARLTAAEDSECGRRTGPDRRIEELAVVEANRRRGERRTGSDRRNLPRS